MYRVVVAGLVLVLAGATGCGSAVSGIARPFGTVPAGVTGAGGASFVGTDTTSAVIITWTNDGHDHVAGSIQYVDVNNNYVQGTASQPLTGENASFTGTDINGSVSLHFELGSTWVGTISGEALTIQLPQTDGTLRPYTLHVATTADYNAAVQVLTTQLQAERATALSQQQAAQTAQEQSSAQQELSNDLAALANDETALSDALARIPPAKQATATASNDADAALAAAKKATGPQADCQNLYNLIDATYTAVDKLWSAADSITTAVGNVDSVVGQMTSDIDRAQKAEQVVHSLGTQAPTDTDNTIAKAGDAATNGKAAEEQAQSYGAGATQHGTDVNAAATAVDTDCNTTG